MTPDYCYQPLQPGEIRLLRLQPRSSNQDLIGSILHIPLQKPTYVAPSEPNTSGQLNYHTPYEAISYHWGRNKAKPFFLIIDNNSRIHISAELHAILQSIVHPTDCKVIWVDAICINQVDSNSKEKEAQIRLMPDIYQFARNVQVHLGRKADNSDLAIQHINHLAIDEYLFFGDRNALSDVDHEMEKFPEDIEDRERALQAFWRRPWFRRIWVIQEFVYANEVQIFCGGAEIDWIRLYIAAQTVLRFPARLFQGTSNDWRLRQWDWLKTKEFLEVGAGPLCFELMCSIKLRAWGYRPPTFYGANAEMLQNLGIPVNDKKKKSGITGYNLPTIGGVNTIEDFFKAAKSSVLSGQSAGPEFSQAGLSSLLFNTYLYQFTNPKDRLYALLGLANDVDHREFSPKYSDTETLGAVCRRFSTRLILNGHCGEVLSLAGYHSQYSDTRETVPSWTPNWTRAATSLDDTGHTMNYLMAVHRLEVDSRFEAAMESIESDGRPAWKNEIQRKRISRTVDMLKELKVGLETLESVEDQVMARGHDFEPSLRIYRAAKESKPECEIKDEKLFIKGSMMDSIILVLPGAVNKCPGFYLDTVSTVLSKYPTGESVYQAVWRTLIANRDSDQYQTLLRPAPDTYEAQFELVKNQIHDSTVSASGESIPDLNFLISYNQIRGRYNLCITYGGYIGLFPLHAKFGDQITVLHGCDTPFVLRSSKLKRDNYYSVVGECYVHGMMQGELFEDSRFKVDKIELR